MNSLLPSASPCQGLQQQPRPLAGPMPPAMHTDILLPCSTHHSYTLDRPKMRCIVQDGEQEGETRLLLLDEGVDPATGGALEATEKESATQPLCSRVWTRVLSLGATITGAFLRRRMGGWLLRMPASASVPCEYGMCMAGCMGVKMTELGPSEPNTLGAGQQPSALDTTLSTAVHLMAAPQA